MANSLLLAALITLAILTLNVNVATSLRALEEECHASGQLQSNTSTFFCNNKNVSNCCEPQKAYPRYHCSPPVKHSTRAIMTFNNFTQQGRIGGPSISKGKNNHLPIMRMGGHESMALDSRIGSLDGNRWGSPDQNGNRKGPSKCGNKYYSDEELVVALSTGWYNGGSRCQKNIRIKGNGKSAVAKVVDECDSVNGCDSEHGFRLPCANNIVDASSAVWKALGIPTSRVGNFQITWSDV